VSRSHHKTTKAKNNDALQDCFLFASSVKRTKNESDLKEDPGRRVPARREGRCTDVLKSGLKTGDVLEVEETRCS
jgi:hypothetical protein